MNITASLLFIWVIITCAIFSITVTMVAVAIVRKSGLMDIDVTNLLMVETCVFAGVLVTTFTLLQGR